MRTANRLLGTWRAPRALPSRLALFALVLLGMGVSYVTAHFCGSTMAAPPGGTTGQQVMVLDRPGSGAIHHTIDNVTSSVDPTRAVLPVATPGEMPVPETSAKAPATAHTSPLAAPIANPEPGHVTPLLFLAVAAAAVAVGCLVWSRAIGLPHGGARSRPAWLPATGGSPSFARALIQVAVLRV